MAKQKFVFCPRCPKGKIPIKNFTPTKPDRVIKPGEYRDANCPVCGITVVISHEGKITFRTTSFP